MEPFGTRILKGLCTGQDVRGPQRDGPGNGTELKLFVLLHGLQSGGGGSGGPCRDSCEGPCTSVPMPGPAPPGPTTPWPTVTGPAPAPGGSPGPGP